MHEVYIEATHRMNNELAVLLIYEIYVLLHLFTAVPRPELRCEVPRNCLLSRLDVLPCQLNSENTLPQAK